MENIVFFTAWTLNGGSCAEVRIGNDVVRMVEAGHGDYARNQMPPRGYSDEAFVKIAERAIADSQKTTSGYERCHHQVTKHFVAEVLVAEDMANLKYTVWGTPGRNKEEERDITLYGRERYGPTWAIIFRGSPHPAGVLRSLVPQILAGEDVLLFPSRHTGIVVRRENTQRKTVNVELIIPRK